MNEILSFAVGVLSSLAAAGLLYLRQRAKYRMGFRSIMRLVESLGDQIDRDGFRYERIVAIGRNSGVVGSILAGYVGLDAIVSINTSKGRSQDGERSIVVDAVSLQSLLHLSGKKVLVLICCNDSGATLAHVVRVLKECNSPPQEIRTASIYTSPSPAFKAQYNAVVLERDSARTMSKVLESLPWVNKKWHHPLAGERAIGG